jgi:hypothetical protein
VKHMCLEITNLVVSKTLTVSNDCDDFRAVFFVDTAGAKHTLVFLYVYLVGMCDIPPDIFGFFDKLGDGITELDLMIIG